MQYVTLRATFLGLLAVQVWAAPAPAAEPNGLPVLDAAATLETYLTYAALNNPGLEAAFNRWKAALERVPQVTSLPDPRFSYRYYIERVETRRGPMRQAVDLTQVFPWFGKLDLAGDVAAQAAAVARQRYAQTRLELFFQVRDAYYEYYYVTRALAVTRENLDLLQRLEAVARTRYATSVGSHPDLIRAQVELGRLEDQRNSLADLRGPVAARVNAALNRDGGADLPVPAAVAATEGRLDDAALLSRLERDNPRLLALLHEAGQYATAGRLARKQYAPDIALGLNYVDVGRYGSVPAGVANGRDAVSAMISLNIPIWGRKYSAAVREAKLRELAAKREHRDTANQLQTALRLALYHYRDAARKLDLYGHGLIPKAQQSLQVTEQAYRTAGGGGSFLDLIDAQRSLLAFELAQERALADHEQALARIDLLVGGAPLTGVAAHLSARKTNHAQAQ